VSVNRLDPPYGFLLDRSQPVRFTFENRQYEGYAGDTIASALAANDVWLLARSFKYHRPRGVFSMSGDDANALVQLADEPNVPADVRAIAEGLRVTGQHYSGSLRNDSGRWIERIARFLPVGFYYRSFFKPRGIWDFWERRLRNFAGLGHINEQAPPRNYDKAYAFADVAVIGAGAAGVAAAIEAGRAGRQVALIERQPLLGGSLNHARFDADGQRGVETAAQLAAEMEAVEDRIDFHADAVCTGLFADNLLSVVTGRRLLKLRADQVIVATGAIEQPLVFANNDLPGIMSGSAAQRLLWLYGVRPGQNAVVVTANGDGYGVALDLAEAGVTVQAVVELRREGDPDPRADTISEKGIPLIRAQNIHGAIAADGGGHIEAVEIDPVTTNPGVPPKVRRIACDVLCLSTGWSPAAALIAQAGGDVTFDEQRHAFAVRTLRKGMHAAGAVNGAWNLETAIADGRDAGRRASGQTPDERVTVRSEPLSHPWPISSEGHGKAFIDFDEDLTPADIENTIAEGFDEIELVKRFATVGMGPSQGRQSATNAVWLTHSLAGRPLDGAARWTDRPPAFPEKFGVLAGRGFEPLRRTPMHDRHCALGAEMMLAGAWQRPVCYGAGDDGTIRDEVTAVHENVGLIDVSTLGGIEVRGPDAAAFLERIYTFAYASQPVGRARYTLMCDTAGAIVDDGVACRFAEDQFYVTTTTGASDTVHRQMLWWNAQWRLDVDIANVTGAYAAVNIAGPQARAMLAPLCDGFDLTAAAFPYMGVRTGHVAGIPARILRVGFVGELGYEIHVPAGCGEALWDALAEAGRPYHMRLFGVDAQRTLRLEKGHIIVGQDTDGLTNPDEAGLDWAVAERKPFFLGKAAIMAHRKRGLDRKLVGFTLPPETHTLPEECHLVIRGDDIVGRVTSIARSPALGRPIGLAYVAPDQAAPGATFAIKGPGGRFIEATVAPLPFYDADNRRQSL
jgi:sarcosine oxidase subunit alpha